MGLPRLGGRPFLLTDTQRRDYPLTVAWCEAAHREALDGAVWMSGRCNTDRAYVLFGDRVAAHDLRVEPDYARVFAGGPDVEWLIDFCATVGVDVLIRGI